LEARLMALLTEAEDARAKVMDDMEVTPLGRVPRAVEGGFGSGREQERAGGRS